MTNKLSRHDDERREGKQRNGWLKEIIRKFVTLSFNLSCNPSSPWKETRYESHVGVNCERLLKREGRTFLSKIHQNLFFPVKKKIIQTFFSYLNLENVFLQVPEFFCNRTEKIWKLKRFPKSSTLFKRKLCSFSYFFWDQKTWKKTLLLHVLNFIKR